MNIVIKKYDFFSTELEVIWKGFEKEAECIVFQNYSWISHWYNHIGKEQNVVPQILLISVNETLTALLPFALKKKSGLNVLCWLGGDQTDYMAPILRKDWILGEQDFKKVWSKILECIPQTDIVDLEKQPKMVEGVLNPFNYLPKIHQTKAFSLILPGDIEELKKERRLKRVVADSRRQRKRLEELGNLSYFTADTQLELEKLASTMTMQKRIRYIETGAQDILKESCVRDFYHYFPLKVDSLEIRCSCLTLDGDILATHWGLVYKDTFYYLMPAFKQGDTTKFSTGRLLLEHLIEKTIKEGIKIFDFSIGSESYKLDWCNSEQELFRVYQPVTFLGKLHVHVIKSFSQLKKKLQQFRVLKKIVEVFRKFSNSLRKMKLYSEINNTN